MIRGKWTPICAVPDEPVNLPANCAVEVELRPVSEKPLLTLARQMAQLPDHAGKSDFKTWSLTGCVSFHLMGQRGILSALGAELCHQNEQIAAGGARTSVLAPSSRSKPRASAISQNCFHGMMASFGSPGPFMRPGIKSASGAGKNYFEFYLENPI